MSPNFIGVPKFLGVPRYVRHDVPYMRRRMSHMGPFMRLSPHGFLLTPSLLHTTIQPWITPTIAPPTFPTTSTLRGMRTSSVTSSTMESMLRTAHGGKAHMVLLTMGDTPSNIFGGFF